MNTATMASTALDAFVHYLATGEDPHHRIAENLKGEMNFPGTSFGLLNKAVSMTCDNGSAISRG